MLDYEKPYGEPRQQMEIVNSNEGFTMGQAALKAASSKVMKHEKACIENQHVFIPFAFDTFGFLAPEAVDLLNRVQRVMHSNVMTPKSMNVVFKRVSFAIPKGVAAQLVARLPSTSISKLDAYRNHFSQTIFDNHNQPSSGRSSPKVKWGLQLTIDLPQKKFLKSSKVSAALRTALHPWTSPVLERNGRKVWVKTASTSMVKLSPLTKSFGRDAAYQISDGGELLSGWEIVIGRLVVGPLVFPFPWVLTATISARLFAWCSGKVNDTLETGSGPVFSTCKFVEWIKIGEERKR
ncbi:hypothetical protein LXL04_035777 [Taraxacum kok-saghyz]